MARTSRTPRASALLILACACAGNHDKLSPAETLDSVDTQSPEPRDPPCADGTWGALTDPTTAWDTSGDPVGDPRTAIQVRVDGDDAGDGSLDAPLATLGAALALSRERDSDKVIFVGPGSYDDVALSVSHNPSADTTDDGLVIAGCRDEVTLRAPDDDTTILRVSEAQDVRLYDLGMEGGSRALWIWQGARVSMARIRVERSGTVGVVMDGVDTLVDITDSMISNTAVRRGRPGVAIGVGVLRAQVRWSGGGVSGSRQAGVLLAGDGTAGALDLRDLTIDDTTADDDGLYGRGLQAQGAVSLSMSGVTISDSVDAGIYMVKTAEASLDGVEISGVSVGTIPDETDTTGDAVVFTSDDGSGDSYDPDDFVLTMTDSTLAGYERAGVLLERVTATLEGNTGLGDAWIEDQDDALVGGSDYDTFGNDTLHTPLPLNHDALDSDVVTTD